MSDAYYCKECTIQEKDVSLLDKYVLDNRQDILLFGSTFFRETVVLKL